MINLIWDNTFKRKLKKLIKNDESLKILIFERLSLFAVDAFHPSLKTHKLTGNLSNCWSFSIDYQLRILFQFVDTNSALLIDIGAHDDVY